MNVPKIKFPLLNVRALKRGADPNLILRIADALNDDSILVAYLENNPVYKAVIPPRLPRTEQHPSRSGGHIHQNHQRSRRSHRRGQKTFRGLSAGGLPGGARLRPEVRGRDGAVARRETGGGGTGAPAGDVAGHVERGAVGNLRAAAEEVHRARPPQTGKRGGGVKAMARRRLAGQRKNKRAAWHEDLDGLIAKVRVLRAHHQLFLETIRVYPGEGPDRGPGTPGTYQ